MRKPGLTGAVALAALVATGFAVSPAEAQPARQAKRAANGGALVAGMVQVPASIHIPLYPASLDETEVPVDAFLMDRLPVTNSEFLDFVKKTPRWRKENVPGVFAAEGYLQHWESAEKLGPNALPDAPVVSVSWFAARAYCAARGKRLPTEAEWEVAAAASETEANARDSAEWKQVILSWYAKPTPGRHPPVGQGKPNFFGIHDLHGLVWEWVEDFNGSFAAVDSRRQNQESGPRFCGSAGLSATENENYASFMRIAFRGSLEARYTGTGLGFRCARDVPTEKRR